MVLQSTNSATGTRTRVARVRAEYPNQLDYSGYARSFARTIEGVVIPFQEWKLRRGAVQIEKLSFAIQDEGLL